MRRLYNNALENEKKKSPQGHRHDEVIKQFGTSLLCVNGKAGYELIQCNFGNGLPHFNTAQRVISEQRKVIEGEFYFDELKEHLLKWKAPLFVNAHLDDTRIINKVEYDPATDRFVGFCLPLENGLPNLNAFRLQTFDEIKSTYERTTVGKYAHCIIIKSIDSVCSSFVLFALCTDSKYDNKVISSRWKYITEQLKDIGITLISNGADGAGPFMKVMTNKTDLFKRSINENVPQYWTFFWMPRLRSSSLCCQDTIHLLAKLRTRLLTPSKSVDNW